LGVIARTSVMGYKHSGKRLDQIGRDLSIQYVPANALEPIKPSTRISIMDSHPPQGD
jgi:hypothetical protein